jgi:hypothetical protein
MQVAEAFAGVMSGNLHDAVFAASAGIWMVLAINLALKWRAIYISAAESFSEIMSTHYETLHQQVGFVKIWPL